VTTIRQRIVRDHEFKDFLTTALDGRPLLGGGDGHPGGAGTSPPDDVIEAALAGPVLAPATTALQRLPLRLGATILWLPVALAVATVFGALALPFVLTPMTTPLGVIVFGVVFGAAAWLVHGALTDRAVLPEHANPDSYESLVMRLAVVEDDLRSHLAAGKLTVKAAPVIQFGDLKARLAAVPPKGDWSSGKGYVIAWRDLHRIEEELIATLDESRLDGLLRRDEGRVAGSKLARKDSLVNKQIEEAKKLRVDGKLATGRGLLHDIRSAVDEFRDGTFSALVESRHHLERVSMFLGMIAWATLCIALLIGATMNPVVAVSVLYLIGAAAGLFTQLGGTKATSSSENVFGYGQAEVRLTILASGLAAVGGAFLTWVVAKTSGGIVPSDLAEAFVLTPTTVLTAAFFGLAPATLLDRVKSWGKTSIDDLESTSGADTKEA
jgi:hypothetical protein